MGKNVIQRFSPTERGIELPSDLQFKDWRILFEGYSHMAKSVPWVVGDLLVYGEARYGEKMSQAISTAVAMTTYAQGTIYNLVYVSKNVPLENRNPNLSHSYHYEVAKMETEDQIKWLANAEIHGWTCKQFRRAIKGEPAIEEKIAVQPVAIPEKSSCRGEINDQFDCWWESYLLKNVDVRVQDRQVALDAWNASVL